jgi:hypothetical protein
MTGERVRKPTEREIMLIARCSPKAADYLSQLNIHPLYEDIVDRLSSNASPLYVMDVLSAYRDSLRARKGDTDAHRATWRI